MNNEIIRIGQIGIGFLLGAADTGELAIVTPALIGPDSFKEMAAIANAGGPPDVEKLKAVMLKQGLVPVMLPNSEGVATRTP